MAREEDDDLYDEEFDFVDEDDDDSELDDESPLDDEVRTDDRDRDDLNDIDDDEDARSEPARRESRDDRDGRDSRDDRHERDDRIIAHEADGAADEGPVDEFGRPEPAANYVVHVYEHKQFTRTIDRPFTPEDAEAFITEFNRTGKLYGRVGVSGKNDAKPKKTLE